MAARYVSQPLQGVIPILPVPFTNRGAVDDESFRKVVEASVGDRVDGLAIFGLASEYAKLTEDERLLLIRSLVDQVSGRVPVIVSITHHSLEVAERQAGEAAHMGATALMVLPPFLLSPGPSAVKAHIRTVAAAVDLPVIVQYAPAQAGADFTLDLLAEIVREYPNLQYLKVDQVPSGPTVSGAVSRGLKAMVGYMGLFLPQDMKRGAVAVMPTVSVAKGLVRLWQLLQENPEEGRRAHQKVLPLLQFMMQSVEMLVAVEKLLLVQRGWIAHDYRRAPRRDLDDWQKREIETLCAEQAEFLGWSVAGRRFAS